MEEILGSNPVIATILYSRQSTHSMIHLVQANEYSEYSSKSEKVMASKPQVYLI